MKFGSDFKDCLKYYNPKLIGPDVLFRSDSRREGFKNTHWQFIKFQNYQLRQVSIDPVQEIPQVLNNF